MKKDLINYSDLVDDAMHFIVKKSLTIFAKGNVDGDHHFFISFITKHPGVSISKKLQNKYPYEMTIVLQYQFEDLEINETDFSVILSFDNQREKIVIPFAALTAFADPSVKFGLQFRHVDEDIFEEGGIIDPSSITSNKQTDQEKPIKTKSSKEETLENNVISLDFRNKKIIK